MHWRIPLTPINEAMARDWPEATRMNFLDDSPSSDMAAGGRKLDTAMHERFQRLSQYALDCGSDAVLFTCTAFGPCIEEVARRHPSSLSRRGSQAMGGPVRQRMRPRRRASSGL